MPEKFYLCRALLIRINRGSVTQGHSLQAQPLENDRFVGPLGAGRQKRDQRGDTEPRARLRPLPGIRTEPAGPKPQHGRIENHRTDPPLDFGHLLRPHRRPDRVGSRAGRLLADDRRFELRNRTGKRPDTAFPVEKGRRHHHRPGRRFGTRGRPPCGERLPGRAVRPRPRENGRRLRGDRQRGGQPCAGPSSCRPGIPQNRHHHDLPPPPDDGTAAQGLPPRAGGSGTARRSPPLRRGRLCRLPAARLRYARPHSRHGSRHRRLFLHHAYPRHRGPALFPRPGHRHQRRPSGACLHARRPAFPPGRPPG